MLDVVSNPQNGSLEITVDGLIDRAGYERVVAAVDALLKDHNKIDVIEIVREIGWIAPEVWWKDLVFHLTHLHAFRRAAVVSDAGWIGPVTRFFAPLYPAAIRAFSMSDVDEARLWVHGSDAIP